jgi:hypothetical protein
MIKTNPLAVALQDNLGVIKINTIPASFMSYKKRMTIQKLGACGIMRV